MLHHDGISFHDENPVSTKKITFGRCVISLEGGGGKIPQNSRPITLFMDDPLSATGGQELRLKTKNLYKLLKFLNNQNFLRNFKKTHCEMLKVLRSLKGNYFDSSSHNL